MVVIFPAVIAIGLVFTFILLTVLPDDAATDTDRYIAQGMLYHHEAGVRAVFDDIIGDNEEYPSSGQVGQLVEGFAFPFRENADWTTLFSISGDKLIIVTWVAEDSLGGLSGDRLIGITEREIRNRTATIETGVIAAPTNDDMPAGRISIGGVDFPDDNLQQLPINEPAIVSIYAAPGLPS